MASPINLPLGKELCIGKLIGQGAFGQVHAVVKNRKETQWACKLTAVPIKKTKKGDSTQEVAFMRLWSEYMLYSSHFRHLSGVILPKLPAEMADGLKLYHDNLNGYRCLVMERMESKLFDALPQLVEASTKTVNLGPVITKLLDIVEEIHKTGHILLDVKPDNLMVCASTGENLTPSESFASSIRLVDLGIVKSFGGAYGHKENVGCTAVQGTPLYAGLHVHALETPSRRDDVEAMLYLIGDLVLTVHGIVNHLSPPYGRGENASYLPWSQESSDAAIGKVKAAQVGDLASEYYSSMPKPVAATLYEANKVVHGYKYFTTPDYETLRRLLRPIEVKLPTAKKRGTAKAASPIRASGGRGAAGIAATAMRRSPIGDKAVPPMHRSTSGDKASVAAPRMQRSKSGDKVAVAAPPLRRSQRRGASAGDEQPTLRRTTRSSEEAALDTTTREESPRKVAKTNKSRYKVEESDFESDVSMEDVASDDGSYHLMEPEDMMVDDDDDNRKPAAKTTKFRGIKLVVKGHGFVENVTLVEGGTESIVIGSKPVNSCGETLELSDGKLEASHVRFTLSKNHNGVQVDPLSKKATVQVNRLNVQSSGTTAFCGQGITFGDNLVEVQNLREEEYGATTESWDENRKPPAEVKKAAFRGVKLDIKGPGFDETVILVEGGTESVVLGKNPISKRDGDELMVLSDPALMDSHVRLTLSEMHEGVQVVPLSKKGIVHVNRMNVPASGTTAFLNQVIAVGETIVGVTKLRPSDMTEPSARSCRSSSGTTRAMAVTDANVAAANPPSVQKKSPVKAKARRRAIVKITSGPNTGVEYVLEQGVCDTIVVGSAPTRKGHPLKLLGAKGVAPNHTCLDLIVNGQTVMVKVTDLKSEGGTIVNGKRMASGKNDMAFCGSSSIQVGDTILQILRA